jgi:hypothetical protein
MTRRSRKHRGGASTQESMRTLALTPAPVTESSPLLSGGRKHRRSRHHKRSHKRRHRGGNMLATAALPFGLFGLQKFFQKSRVNPLRRIGRSARRTVKRVF